MPLRPSCQLVPAVFRQVYHDGVDQVLRFLIRQVKPHCRESLPKGLQTSKQVLFHKKAGIRQIGLSMLPVSCLAFCRLLRPLRPALH